MPRPPHHLLTALGPASNAADADLLARFVAHKDSGAFELLVHRHAPLVLRVCRAMLRDHHAAEDAAQAVFLALARQAGSVRATLTGWLFRVGRRIAAQAVRRRPPAAVPDLDALPAPATSGPDPSEVQVLHDELSRLPEAYRAPLLLCYVEGLPRAEAARRLGWPVGTVNARVARGKAKLAARLARRGLAPGVLVVAVEVVPPGFAGATAEAAVGYAAGRSSVVKEAVAGLVTREMRRAAMVKAAKLVGVVLTLGAVALGLGAATGGDPPAASPAAAAKAQPPAPAPAEPTPPRAVVGKTFAVAPVTTDLQRLLLRGGPTLAAFVSVNAEGLFPGDGSLDPAALDLKGIRAALATFKPTPAQAVSLDAYFQLGRLPGPPPAGREVVRYALEGMAVRAGFGQATAWNTNAHAGWGEHIAPLREDAGAADREKPVGDDNARAFPVRTPLSRVLADGMAGVVEVRVRVDVAGRAVPDGLTASVGRALRDLHLPRGSRVHFLLNNPPTGADAAADGWLRRVTVDWAAAADLEGGTFTARG